MNASTNNRKNPPLPWINRNSLPVMAPLHAPPIVECGGGRPSSTADLKKLLGMASAGRPRAVWAGSGDDFDSGIPAGLGKDRFSPEDHK